jgi:hypothetical protein
MENGSQYNPLVEEQSARQSNNNPNQIISSQVQRQSQ